MLLGVLFTGAFGEGHCAGAPTDGGWEMGVLWVSGGLFEGEGMLVEGVGMLVEGVGMLVEGCVSVAEGDSGAISVSGSLAS